MAELAAGAGLPPPEIDVTPGAVVVRFRPGRYTAPYRVARDLSPRQQQVLEMLAAAPRGLALRVIRVRLDPPAREWEVKEDLALLRQLGLIEPRGYARGARWLIAGSGTGH